MADNKEGSRDSAAPENNPQNHKNQQPKQAEKPRQPKPNDKQQKGADKQQQAPKPQRISAPQAKNGNPSEETAPAAPAAPKIKVGITHGDYNGIGYEVIIKAFDDPRMLELCTPVIYGSAKIASFYRKTIQDNTPASQRRTEEHEGMAVKTPPTVQIASPLEARPDAINIINVIGQEAHITPGESSQEAGQASFVALERAVADIKEGLIDVLVTAPINKNNIHSDVFIYPGHTEYLEAALGQGEKALMILCNDNLRVALVTTHLPIAKVPEAISKEAILEKLQIFSHSLTRDFSIVKPRIAVLALNPHASDGGLIGREEQEVIIPAIAAAKEEGIMAFGPYPADGFFGNGLFAKFDGVLAMYHDQGLAPFKTLSMDSGVNFTAGLPVVRTSPDHGTGYDIAGRNLADESSMRQAIYRAIDVLRSRRIHAEITANPLRKLFVDKGKDNVVLDLK